jgi:hypothetical protein
MRRRLLATKNTKTHNKENAADSNGKSQFVAGRQSIEEFSFVPFRAFRGYLFLHSLVETGVVFGSIGLIVMSPVARRSTS